MNFYEELKSKKTLGVLFLICFMFVALIVKAFTYLPNEPSNNMKTTESEMSSTVKPVDTENNVTSEENSEGISEKIVSNDLNIDKKNLNTDENIENLEPINGENSEENSSNAGENNQENLSIDEQINKMFDDALRYNKEKQYVNAIEEYKKIIGMTSDQEVQAKSYEGIAVIYAVVKKYGTALSYAQKAFNLSPSTSREILLARLYYKTGNIDKATARINNVLKRDFSADR